MKKRRFQSGGNLNSVPASRQNIEQRTPSGVRPVASPVVPVGNVQGTMKNGGELKMKKPKKMAMGGMPGPMPGGFGGGRGAYMGPGADPRPPSTGPIGGPLARQRGGRGVDQGGFMGGSGSPVPGGGFGGGPGTYVGPGGAPRGSFPTGPQAFSPDGAQFAQNVGPLKGGFLGGPGSPMGPGAGGMPMGGGMSRVPAMKKGGKVSASSYNDMTGGAAGGIGRLEKSSIAAKTKSQKLKKGGKVKGYYEGGDISKDASGGDYLSLGDRLAAKKAGIDPNAANNQSLSSYTPDRSIAMAEYRARQDAAEKRARKPAAKPKKPMSFTNAPATKTSGPIDIPMEGGGYRGYFKDTPDAKMQEFLRRKRTNDAANGANYLKKGGKVKGYATGGELSLGDRLALERAGFDPETRMKRSGSSYGKAPYESANLPAPKKKSSGPKAVDPETGGVRMTPSQKRTAAAEMGVTLDENRYGDSERGNGPGSYAKPEKSLAARQREAAMQLARDKGITDPDKIDDMIYRAQNMRKGGKAKMAKGGKVETFEGTAKDMAQDKKLAKKHGMSLKAWEKSSADTKHDTQENMKGLKKGGHVKGCNCMSCGGAAKYAMGGKVSTAQTGMKTPLRSRPSAMTKMAKGGMVEGSPREEAMDKRQAKKSKMSMAAFEQSGKDVEKKAKGGKVGMTFGKPLPGTKVSSQKIRSTVSTAGANMKKDGMKGTLRAKASGAKATAMMKPLGMTKMAKGGKVRGAGIAQRGTKFIGEV